MQHNSKKIIINTSDKVHVLNAGDIIYIKAKASYSVFVLTNKEEVLSSQPLALYSKSLQSAGFYRVHKSFLVNLNHIAEIIRSGDVVLTGGVEIPIAKGNIKPVIEALIKLQ
ncbi:LytR/AlgR family response regulator transcription factor [Ferruginibacter sp. SUN106]|uniref:LytR/AlgR family response regulator transcription factor n=1 Tax=Ferruginibacter sp. SUN106 TaxID=2978348 RepID=UPI003D361A66